MEKGISVIFPVHNESKNIERVVKDAVSVLENLFRQFEIIIVDDGSSDGTNEIATRLTAVNKDIHVVRHRKNRGYGATVRSGFEKASFDLILLCDGDGQFDISEIQKLLSHIESYDFVIGYRKNRRDPFYRKLLGQIWSFMISCLFKVNFKDINCGFKLLKSHIIKGLNLYSIGGVISAEILVRANQKNVHIKEVPVNHKQRIYGKQSGASPRTIALAAYELASLFLRFVLNR